MRRVSFAKQCLDLLHSHEARQWIAPFVNMIVDHLYPYAYIGIGLVCVLLVILFVLLSLVLYLARKIQTLTDAVAALRVA